MGGLGAVEDFAYDSAAAEDLARSCDSAASAVAGQGVSRSGLRRTGLADFAGFFSEVFRDNGVGQSNDATALAAALRQVAAQVRQVAAAAREEKERRRVAREWQSQHAAWWETVGDWLWGEDKPPVGPEIKPLRLTTVRPTLQARQTPQAGSGGSGSGVSSACPDNLRAFASGMRNCDQELRGWPAVLRRNDDAFKSSCQWGGVSADGVWGGFDAYLTANGQDADWADTLAAAFERAGGSGPVSLPDVALTAALQAAGAAVTRGPLEIDPPTGFGGLETTGYADDPVNTATGNLVEPERDLVFAGGCAGLGFTRTYNSLNRSVGAFGLGWSSPAESRLDLADDQARWTRADGRVVVFPRLGPGWDRSAGASWWLAAGPDGAGWVASDNAGGRWGFTAAGRPAWSSRGAGTRVEASWDDAGRLTGLAHERGRALTVEWAGDRVAAVVADDGRRVAYSYDGQGRLVRVDGPDGSRSYGWDEAGLLSKVVDGDGVVEVETAYDGAGRVARQRSRFGRVTVHTYLPGRVTVVADEDGSRPNTWLADARGRLVGLVDAAGQRQSMAWDRWGGQVRATERDGRTTVRGFDDRGRLVRETVVGGGEVQVEWDDQDRVTRVAMDGGDGAAPAVTVYEYEGDDRNPSRLTDPAGGVTQLTWAAGLLAAAAGPGGAPVRFGYDQHGDLVAVTDPAGHTTRLVRDGLGRVVEEVTPLGFRTALAYDEGGRLASRRDPAGALWRYEWTAAGRLAAVADPLGGRTVVERGGHGEQTATVDPLGRSVRWTVDDVGLVSQLELPDGSVWRYAHDALARLVEATDPAGGVWRQEWDPVGALTATVDPTGVRLGVAIGRSDRSVTVDDALVAVTARLDAWGRV
ncbi:MAG: DUF6531 domain-containing protein, partial [Propionibacteriaceae bacterium]|nr:DUF6531 domain-containing protein [Propionibacteriaceae bacterium]